MRPLPPTYNLRRHKKYFAQVNNKIDITFILGVFTSSIIVWIYLYNIIIDLTTSEPASISLLYLVFSHYVSFLSVLFSFVLLLRHCLEISHEQHEINRLKQFQKIANFSQRALFAVWAPMFVFCITALVSQNMFSNSKFDFLQEIGGFIVRALLCILFFFVVLKINIFSLLSKAGLIHLSISPILILIYSFLLSIFSADVKYKVEKDFYHKNEIARFEIKRKGYFFLPAINSVLYNFSDSLQENSESAYFVYLNKDSANTYSLIEVTYSPQIFEFSMRKYFYINKTEK